MRVRQRSNGKEELGGGGRHGTAQCRLEPMHCTKRVHEMRVCNSLCLRAGCCGVMCALTSEGRRGVEAL